VTDGRVRLLPSRDNLRNPSHLPAQVPVQFILQAFRVNTHVSATYPEDVDAQVDATVGNPTSTFAAEYVPHHCARVHLYKYHPDGAIIVNRRSRFGKTTP